MPLLSIIPNLDGFLADARPTKIITSAEFTIGGLAAGMKTGNPSVGIVIEIEPGVFVVAETSLKLFLSAADVLRTHHGDPREKKSPGPVS